MFVLKIAAMVGSAARRKIWRISVHDLASRVVTIDTAGLFVVLKKPCLSSPFRQV